MSLRPEPKEPAAAPAETPRVGEHSASPAQTAVASPRTSSGSGDAGSGLSITFTVPGIAAPQGSKAPWGAESNPNTRPWRATVAAAAREAMVAKGEGWTSLQHPLASPVSLVVRFTFPRPKSHYGTGRNANTLKDSAPNLHAVKPDLDKLLRAIGDAVTGIVVRDDSQISQVFATKEYGSPAAVVTVSEITKTTGLRLAAPEKRRGPGLSPNLSAFLAIKFPSTPDKAYRPF